MKPKEKAVTNYVREKHNQDECVGFIDGYEKCQEDMADKKYTKDDVIQIMFNATKWDTFKEGEVGYDMSLYEYMQHCLHKLNKQD